MSQCVGLRYQFRVIYDNYLGIPRACYPIIYYGVTTIVQFLTVAGIYACISLNYPTHLAFTMSSSPIPGTIQLVDVDHTLDIRHAGNGDIVLQPTPSDDPDDPLNWSSRRKLLALFCPNL